MVARRADDEITILNKIIIFLICIEVMSSSGRPTNNDKLQLYYAFTAFPFEGALEERRDNGLDNPISELGFMEFNSEDMVYMIYQFEKCPDTGKIHQQGYIEFHEPVCILDILEAYPHTNGMHLSPKRKSRESCRDYCKKEDTRLSEIKCVLRFLPYGPQQFGHFAISGKQGTRTDILNIKKKTMEGFTIAQIGEEYPEIYKPQNVQMFNNIKLYSDFDSKFYEKQCYWIHGNGGSGKSSFVREYCEEHKISLFVMPPNVAWADGYSGQEAVLFEEPNEAHINVEHLLRVTDNYPMLYQIKGSHVKFAPKYVFITSNYDPYDFYDISDPSHPHYLPLERRLNIMDLDNDSLLADLSITQPLPHKHISNVSRWKAKNK